MKKEATIVMTTTSHRIETTSEKREEEEVTKESTSGEREVELATEEIRLAAVPDDIGSETTTELIDSKSFEFETEDRQKESYEVRGTHANVLRMTLKERYETEKIDFGCKVMIDAERMAKDLFLLVSMVLNLYLVLVYPILCFMGEKWLEERLRKRDRQEKTELLERQMIPEMRLDLGMERERERTKRSLRKRVPRTSVPGSD